MKPANRFIIRKEGDRIHQIVDFGISKVRFEVSSSSQANSAWARCLHVAPSAQPKDVDALGSLFGRRHLVRATGGVTPVLSPDTDGLFARNGEDKAIEELRNDLPLGLGDIF
jgi:hypothetical protein